MAQLQEIPSAKEKATISNSAKYNYFKNGLKPSYIDNLAKLEERLSFLLQSNELLDDLFPINQNSTRDDAVKNLQEKINTTNKVINEIDKVIDLAVTQGLAEEYIRTHTPSQFFDFIIKNPRTWGLPANATPKMVMNAIMSEINGSTLKDNFPHLDDQLKPLPKEIPDEQEY